jgi:hypothetical protein
MTALQSPEDIRAAKPLLTTALVISGILAALMIAAGTIAIVIQARGATTTFSILGIKVSTGDVGVALVALGAASSVLVIRKLFKVITELAKIPK